MLAKIEELKKEFKGDIYTDNVHRVLYATDASVYREIPLAIARPKTVFDIIKLIALAKQLNTSLIPRTAGTSLAGQVVGTGIVVDVSKYFTKILEVNQEERWVRVQPGVVRDELNEYLKPYGLFFGPETSTSNRCMIGGMIGNNACGNHSPLYGTTRDHTLEIKSLLADGSEVLFKSMDKATFFQKMQQNDLEGSIYKRFYEVLSEKVNQEEIKKEFPDPKINRRNTGYAIDVLLESNIFTEGKELFNFSKLLCGSEGTLAISTEAKLALTDLPPEEIGILVIHCNSVRNALLANVIAMKYRPGASELLDKTLLDCTKQNKNQAENRTFINGDPQAILYVEFQRDSRREIATLLKTITEEIQNAGLGYDFPIVWGKETQKIRNLRKAGLGVLANLRGNPKAVACIEDTSVTVEDLPNFISEFDEVLKKHNKESVYYAHAGDGQLHLRPILDLKKGIDRELFYKITDDVATLVKKYRGSLSGEHGDGRVRGPFIKKMIGEHNYRLIEEVKRIWDPQNIFNPGKITNTLPMNKYLRYEKDMKDPVIETMLDFSGTDGILKMAEKCNGTGLCRKSHHAGGTMCPSYMATKNEKESTRGRANILREFLTQSTKKNRFDHNEIKEVMDLCLGCKGCKSDCPSNVDVAAMKSEFLFQYQKENGIPLASKIIASVAKSNAIFSHVPWVYNRTLKLPTVRRLMQKYTGISTQRSLPELHKFTLRSWFNKYEKEMSPKNPIGEAYFFADEIINYNDVEIGISSLRLLWKLGYKIILPKHLESGRPAISTGVLDYAKEIAEKNVTIFNRLVTDERPLIGIEPSSIFTFRDEYPLLVGEPLKSKALSLSKNTFSIEEFIYREIQAGRISKKQFIKKDLKIMLHGHCFQKSLSSQDYTKKMLELVEGFNVETIQSGCCGMSGSFGYDRTKYELSMEIGELVLFPTIRKSALSTVIVAPGTSCRHQIMDGTQRVARHPSELLIEQVV